jgi:hypothetical protein
MRSTLCLVLALAAAPVRAGPPFTPAAAVAPAVLDGARGGFTTASGLAVSLGIERIVTVDGQVAARTELQLGDLGRLVGGAPPPSAQAATQLVQAGAGAGLAIRIGPAALPGVFVQNSLNGQAIGTATIIHASVATQGMLQAMHFQSTLANALNATATGR